MRTNAPADGSRPQLHKKWGAAPAPFRARDVALLAAASALLYGVQVVLAPLPNIEGVSLLIILFTLTLGSRALWSVAVFILLEGLTYGFGLWWFFYLYAWPVLAVLVLLLRRVIGDSVLGWSLLSAAFGLMFGLLYALLLLLIGNGFSGMLAAWVAGFPFDIAHCIGNFVLCLALLQPLRNVLRRLTA